MLFDPMGFLALHVIRAKILLQEMWASGFDWHDLLHQIQGRRAKIWELGDVQLLHCLQLQFGCREVTLHTFTDALGEAHGTVSAD